MPRVIHFEIHADDPSRAVKFYTEVFGWKIEKWQGPMDYWLVYTGKEEPGIDGAIMKREQPLRGGDGIVDIEDLAPFAKDTIGRDHDRAALITGCHHLEHQVGSPLVDRQIAQLVEQQQLGTGVLFQLLLQRPIDLRGGKYIDHVNSTRPTDGDSLFTSGVPQCVEEMTFSRSGFANQHAALMLRDEFAVKQAEDLLFGNPLREREVITFQGFARG